MKSLSPSRTSLRILVTFLSLFFGTSVAALAQETIITGKVSASGEVLAGVNVVVKGTTNGTISDFDGNFKISVPQDTETLVFSFIGYKTIEEPIGSRSYIEVTLVEDAEQLEEIVVVGYGTMKKSDLTGAVNTVTMDDLPSRPTANVEELLQGQAAGLQITNSSGQPGSSVNVQLRGVSSLTGDSSPLLVVDGFPMGGAGNLKQINPNDIQSIEILKDASASAIYGSRGANGVIMITTKRGKSGKMNVNFNSRVSVQTPPSNFNTINDPASFALISNEGRTNAGMIPLYNGSNFLGTYYPSVSEIQSGEWGHRTDWADVVYRNALAQDYNFSANGGTETSQYYFSLGYLGQEGMNIGDEYKRINARFSLDQEIFRNVKAGFNIIFSNTDQDNSAGGGIGRSPVFPVYDENGDYFRIGNQDFYHPIILADEVLNKNRGTDFISNLYLDWGITDDLKLRTQLNYKNGNSVSDLYEPIGKTWNGNEWNGYGSISNFTDHDILSETYLTYNKTVSDKHRITAMAGWSAQRYEMRNSQLVGKGFVNDNLQNQNLYAADIMETTNSYQASTLLSAISRLNYVFDDRYLITATMRADGSSKFGQNNRWGYFPSVALGWNLHKESFMQDIEAISSFKVRASWGQAGNQGLDPYQINERYGTARYPNAGGGWSTGFGPGTWYTPDFIYKYWQGMANGELKWETTTTSNLGVDISLFNSRVMLTAEVYDKYTTDLLRSERVAPSAGYDEVLVNDGAVRNNGYEISLDVAIFTGDASDFEWSVKGTFSQNRNEVVEIGSQNLVWFGGDVERFRSPVNVLIPGQPIGAFYGYKTNGIIQSVEEGLEAGLRGDEARPGEIKYVNLQGDEVDADDRTVIGNPNPDFIYSISSSMRYKNFDFSFLLNGVNGNDVYNMTRFEGAAQLNRWTPDNPTNAYPSLNDNRLYRASDWWIEDGSFLRIQNITLGYTMPQKVNWIQNLRAYVSIDNPYIFSKFQYGFDPEVAANGIHWGGYPQPTTYSFGLNVTLK
ncbi:SusC/RagA family TonB-linked outer membrane protein [Sediminitomix flava]|uniref:TonB-linked SusC/RagA family outer membrane protein n=1 Tax=Sediminitomix flava TaxID=379075 RepID=A0A315ZD03_SEDFL|nr:TonB-dependent receptor [Sediminitomix flava]PWJ43162.1 TonB-linked SusC/RagA family outer membrane protein [Sediminitomix flava]